MRPSLPGLLLAAVFCTPALAADKVALTLDAAKPGPVISRHVFGQFAEHLGNGIYEGVWVGPDSPIPNTRGIRKDVVGALKALKVPNVRWPGGCFADEYHWRNGVGTRRASMNASWGGVIEPNTFGTHEFMDFVEQIGADAYISANMGSGSRQEAGEWLEYMTAKDTALAAERAANGHPAPWKVSFWGLGNEAWGCGGSMTAEQYVGEMKMYSRASRNYNKNQPAMVQIAVGPDAGATEYTEAVMKAWSTKVWSWDIQGLSLHSYTVNGWPPSRKATGFGEGEYAPFIKETLGMETLVATHSAIMDKYDPARKIALVVDEWGAWLKQDDGTPEGSLRQQNSQRDAIVAALNLNIFARHADRVRMANVAQMVNVLQAMVLTDKEKMVLTPTYHVFKMYVPFQDATLVPVHFDAGSYSFGDISMPRADVIAAKDKEGKLWLALTNIDPKRAIEFDLALTGLKAGSASGHTLAAPKIDSVNTFAAPDTVSPKAVSAKAANGKLVLSLAPQSVTVIALNP